MCILDTNIRKKRWYSYLQINTTERTTEFYILLFLLSATNLICLVWSGVVKDAKSIFLGLLLIGIGSNFLYLSPLPKRLGCSLKFTWKRVLMTFLQQELIFVQLKKNFLIKINTLSRHFLLLHKKKLGLLESKITCTTSWLLTKL